MFFIVLEHLCRRNAYLRLILIENLSELYIYGCLMVLRVDSLDKQKMVNTLKESYKMGNNYSFR